MRVGRTLTKAFGVETRQHELLGMDLGEGPKRSHLRMALVIGVLWILLCVPFVGVPNPYTLSIYVLPPGLLLAFGTQESPSQPRRVRLTDWLLALRYSFTAHRPIVWLGSRRADPKEYVALSVRLHWEKLRELPGLDGFKNLERDSEPKHHSRSGPVGKPIVLEQKTRMIGTDYLHELAAKRQAKAGKASKK
jgi:hypothetical protein